MEAGGYTKVHWEAALTAYNHRCAYCNQWFEHLQREHVVPLARGGTHHPSNIVPACWSCNKYKGTRIVGYGLPVRLTIPDHDIRSESDE